MKETFFKSIAAVGAGIVTTLLGGWDNALEILLICVILDYVTGIGAAYKTKTLKSSVGYEGLLKKGSIFLVIILAAQLGRITGNTAAIFRTSSAFFFMSNEGISILENVGEMGLKLPGFLAKALEKMRDTNDKLDGEEDDHGDQ